MHRGRLQIDETPRAPRARGRHRRRSIGFVAAFATTALIASVLLIAELAHGPSAEAVPGGALDPTAAPWAALINYSDINGNHVCSGSLIDRQWVLTAAHCGRPLDRKTLNNKGQVTAGTRFLDKIPEANYRIQLGSAFSGAPGQSFGVRRNISAMPAFDATGGIFNDWALLQLDSPSADNVSPMPLLPLGTQPTTGAAVTFTGWGITESSGRNVDTGTGAGTELLSTRPGEWKLAPSCAEPLSLCYTSANANPISAPAGGDSGSAATADLRGSRVQIGVYSGGPVGTPNARFGASIGQLNGAIRAIANIPELPRMKVLTEAGSTASWFIDASGFRQHIPSPAVFSCLIKRYGKATVKPLVQIASAPKDDTKEASCPGATGPGPVPVPGPGSTAPVIAASSGLAGQYFAISFPQRCPSVPAGMRNEIVGDAIGPDGQVHGGVAANVTADGQTISEGIFWTDWRHATSFSAGDARVVPDAPTGAYRVTSRCQKFDPRTGTTSSTLAFNDTKFIVNGPSPVVHTDKNRAKVGETIHLTPSAKCPQTDHLSVPVSLVPYPVGNYLQAPSSAVATDTDGNWSAAFVVPPGATGRYWITADCSRAFENSGMVDQNYGYSEEVEIS